MESQQLTLKSKKKTGKIVIITLAVALIAALGFIVWQNFIYQEPKVAEDSKTTSSSADSDKEAKDKPVIPDMIDYGQEGIKITSQADLAKLTNAPDSLKSYLNGILEQSNLAIQTDECTTVVYVQKIYKQQFAKGQLSTTGASCVGGAAHIWGNVDGSWKKIGGTQDVGFGCADLEKYKVPAVIAGDVCVDMSKPEGRPYVQS